MQSRAFSLIFAVTLALAAAARADEALAVAPADAGEQIDEPIQKMLSVIKDASTWGHPDEFGQYSGIQRFAKGDFDKAMEYFKMGAYYADKFSQLSIGLMYLNGNGVARDPVAAYAWFKLAAERGYPDFVATRDRVAAELTPEQRAAADKVSAELEPKYGDAVAKPRMAKQLRLARTQLTGSHTGYDSGAYSIKLRNNCNTGSGDTAGGRIVKSGCGGTAMNSPERWDPDKYFALRDAQYKGTVEVGEIQGAVPPASPTSPADQR